jgi:hypothetical protein
MQKKAYLNKASVPYGKINFSMIIALIALIALIVLSTVEQH